MPAVPPYHASSRQEALERQYGLNGHTAADPDLIFPEVREGVSCLVSFVLYSLGPSLLKSVSRHVPSHPSLHTAPLLGVLVVCPA
jgi:hypothetical protein